MKAPYRDIWGFFVADELLLHNNHVFKLTLNSIFDHSYVRGYCICNPWPYRKLGMLNLILKVLFQG